MRDLTPFPYGLALEGLTREALQLSNRQRLALAGFLLELDRSSDSLSSESDWEGEILSRIEAIDSGVAKGIPYSEVMRVAEDRL
jgi:hypothetical protein